MTERVQRPDSEEERTIWFANLIPDASNLGFDDFKFGLGATDEIFTTIQELIDQAYENHGLDNAALLPGGPDFRRAVTEATRDLLTIFEVVPDDWMNTWCETLMLNIWNKKRAAKEVMRRSKEPSPALADSPTTGKEILRFSQPPAPRPETMEPVEQRKKEPLPLYQRTFVLEVINSDQPSLQAPHILEIISVRCVAEGRDPKLVKNYQLNLFINEFEDILNSGNPNGPRRLSHGKIVYFYGGSGNRALGRGRSTRRMIATQRHFEVAVAHLLNHTNGDSLTFTFFQEDSQEKIQRLAAEKQKLVTERRAGGATKQAEQAKLKQWQDKQRAQEAREKREAAAVGTLTKPKAQAPPIPQKDPRRKIGEKLRTGEPPELSRRRPVPHQIHVSERGSGLGSTKLQPLHPSERPELYQPILTSIAGESSDRGGQKPGAEELRVPDKGSGSRGATIKSRGPSTTSPFRPISTPILKKPASAANYSRGLLPPKSVPNRAYPTSSSPSEIDKSPLKNEYSSVLHPGAPTPSPLGRRRKVVSAAFETVNTGRRLVAVDGTATDPKESYRKMSNKDEKSLKSIPGIPPASREIERVRRESGFHAQPPSPAMRRSTVASRMSSRASISLHSISGIRSLFKHESKDVKSYASTQELDIAPKHFYKEISRRKFARGGEIEQEISIEQLKDTDVAKIDNTEVEEPEQPGDFETPEEYLISR
jgi:hypothetical protein